MVEGAPLLREYTGNGIEGSNPFVSAITSLATQTNSRSCVLVCGGLNEFLSLNRHDTPMVGAIFQVPDQAKIDQQHQTSKAERVGQNIAGFKQLKV